MEEAQGQVLEMVVRGVEEGPVEAGYQEMALLTNLGDVECRYYRAPEARQGAIWVGGAGGGWDSPARGQLYPKLAADLLDKGISSLRVRYRHPNDLDQCTLDLLAGADYLEREGIDAMAVTGHSFGGAVAIQAAAAAPGVRTVVALSTQSHGAAPAAELGPRCSILVIHGTADQVLPPYSGEYVYRIAEEPKRLIMYPGAGHGLDEAAGELRQAVRDWIAGELQRAIAVC